MERYFTYNFTARHISFRLVWFQAYLAGIRRRKLPPTWWGKTLHDPPGTCNVICILQHWSLSISDWHHLRFPIVRSTTSALHYNSMGADAWTSIFRQNDIGFLCVVVIHVPCCHVERSSVITFSIFYTQKILMPFESLWCNEVSRNVYNVMLSAIRNWPQRVSLQLLDWWRWPKTSGQPIT